MNRRFSLPKIQTAAKEIVPFVWNELISMKLDDYNDDFWADDDWDKREKKGIHALLPYLS